MNNVKSWEVSDEFWTKVEPLIPNSSGNPEGFYTRRPGGGRKSGDKRKVFEAMYYVLRTGIQWLALPKEKFRYRKNNRHPNFIPKWYGRILGVYFTSLA